MFSVHGDENGNKLVGRTKGFGANLSSHKVYDENMTSEKQNMLGWIQDLQTSLSDDLDMTVEGDRLVACMIRKSVDQSRRILDFITNFYRNLTTSCRYPPKEAWELVGRLVRHFFVHLRSERIKALGIEDIRPAHARSRLVWTMMQSHNVAQEIIDQGFQNSPVLMNEVLEFQLEHRVDASQLTSVVDEVKALKAQVKEAINSSTKAEKGVGAMTEKIAKLNQDLGNTKVEVKRLGTKKP